MVGDDGRPYIVDWSASISQKEFRFFPLNRIYLRFVLDDYFAIIKLKMRYASETLTLGRKKTVCTTESYGKKVLGLSEIDCAKFLKKLYEKYISNSITPSLRGCGVNQDGCLLRLPWLFGFRFQVSGSMFSFL